MEADANLRPHRLRPPILHGRLEEPFFDGQYGLLIEPQSQPLGHGDLVRAAIHADGDPEHDRALVFRLACSIRELRVRRVDRYRVGNAGTFRIRSTADIAAFARAQALPVTAADATASAGADSGEGSGAIGGHD